MASSAGPSSAALKAAHTESEAGTYVQSVLLRQNLRGEVASTLLRSLLNPTSRARSPTPLSRSSKSQVLAKQANGTKEVHKRVHDKLSTFGPSNAWGQLSNGTAACALSLDQRVVYLGAVSSSAESVPMNISNTSR